MERRASQDSQKMGMYGGNDTIDSAKKKEPRPDANPEDDLCEVSSENCIGDENDAAEKRRKVLDTEKMGLTTDVGVVNKDVATVEKTMTQYKHGVIIKQRFEPMEDLLNCEFPKVYYIYGRDENGKKDTKSFMKFKDRSDYCDRRGCSGCKRYNMRGFHHKAEDGVDKKEEGKQCLECLRDCQCTFLCCNRHDMRVNLVGRKSKSILGRVRELWDPLHYRYNIYLGEMDHCFTITGGLWQLYFWCRCPCEQCTQVAFELKDARKNRCVGGITRLGRLRDVNKYKALRNDDLDVYIFDWPSYTKWQERTMLTNMAVFIDFMLFEEVSEHEKRKMVDTGKKTKK